MKRGPMSREALALHEAGHLVAMSWASEPGEFVWRRLPRYEIAHIDFVESVQMDWESPSHRNAVIVERAVVALAGGAAEFCGESGGREAGVSIETIHRWVGRVDFELAHEWLTLQRYDGDQNALEGEMRRLFLEVCEVLDTPSYKSAIDTVRGRILEHLSAADSSGAVSLRVPSGLLGRSREFKRIPQFSLKLTLAQTGRNAD